MKESAIIHILAADGTHSPHEESQVRQMLKQRQLSPDTLYWKEGMAEWRPLKELPASVDRATLRPKPFEAESTTTHYHFRKKPGTLTMVLSVMLVVYIAATSLHLYGIIDLKYGVFEKNVPGETVLDHLRWMAVFAYILTCVHGIKSIAFYMWIYRTNYNCWGFARNLKFTPGWAVGWYFIPLAELVYPCLCMQEIWKVSSDPYNWKLENNSVLVGFWWAFWLSTEIIATMLFVSITEAHLHYSEFYQRNFPTLITMDVSRIILALLTIILVNVITQKQKKLTE